MARVDVAVVKSTAQTYRLRFGACAREQAELRAFELVALGSEASGFWWAVVSELRKNPLQTPNDNHPEK